jgi:BMFP domain-containing protein YqiC
VSDSAYLYAVRRGDMKTAQRMVDAAAKAAGYTIESFHGTNGDLFTVFDPEKGGEKTAAESARLGIFSTDNAKVAQSYAENLGMGGAMGLAFGSGPFAKARADALETPQGKRLMQELEDSKQAVQKAHQKVRKEVTDKVMKQVESNPDLLDIVKRYGNEFVTSMVNNAWVSNEMYLSKAIVDAEKDQAAAEERLSNYIMPFIVAKLPNKRVLQLRLKINNPKIYDAGGKSPAEFSLSDKIETALDLGYDGVIFNNIIDPVESATHYVVFKPEQIKLADAVTKDDAGKVIPLSQRFNSESPDIRNPKLKHGLNNRERIMRNPATSDDMPGGFLTQKHSAQIDTPAFKRWFNGSVIVDAYGGPRIMYHGTVWTDISKFESFRAQKGIAGFFAFDPAFAAEFAKMYAEEYENEGVRKSPTVYPVYLSLKKVFDVRKKSDREEIDWEIQPGSLDWDWAMKRGWDWADLEDSVNAMKRAGFDGYIDFEFGSNKPPTGIAVFDPRNIKSAIGNRGTFDPTDPDIRNPKMTSRVHYRLNPDSKGKGMNTVRSKLSQIIEPGDRMVCYDTAKGEDFYRLWDIVHTALPLTEEALTEIEGMLDDDGVLVIESGETPSGLQDHFRKATRYNGLLLVQGPKDPEGARIKTEELRRELE